MSDRAYGVDVSDEWESIAQAERMPDGAIRMTVVQIEREAATRD